MKQHFKSLLVFLSLASIILVLNNCEKVTFNDLDEIQSSNKAEGSLKNNTNLRNGENINTDNRIIPDGGVNKDFDKAALAETLSFFLSITEMKDSKESLVEYLNNKNIGVRIGSTIPYPGLEDRYTIKTRKSLKGLKHILASYVKTNDENEVLESISFDIPKSDNVFVKAINFIEKNFPEIGEPVKDPDYNFLVIYKYGDYHINIIENFWEDLEGDIDFPYTEADEGSVTISIYRDQHDD